MACKTPPAQMTRPIRHSRHSGHSTGNPSNSTQPPSQEAEAHRSPLRQCRRISRGQAIVEFALVAPLFFAVIFGLLEFSLIGASISSYNFAAKDGARIGSLLGRTDGTVDQQIVSDIQARTAGFVLAKATKIEIFHADVTGQPIVNGNTIVENVYDIQGNLIGTAGWPVIARHDQLLDADYLGVRITFLYTYLTGFISGGNANLQLTATSVQRIEPQDYQGRMAPRQIAATTSIAWHPQANRAVLTATSTPLLSRFADRPRPLLVYRQQKGVAL